MKKFFFLLLILPFFTSAQDKTLLVEGVSPNLFITHKVAPKENYYSIGRIYNISPRDIAPFNNLQLESGLSLGQNIRIPLNNSNFFQAGNADADETFVPVYYAVKGKEGLYRVALNHNDVPLETLKQWNNIKADAVKNGTKLIVGYLKVKTELSTLAKKGIGTSIEAKGITVKTDEKKIDQPEIVTIPVEKKETVKINTKAEKKEAAKAAKQTVTPETKRTGSVKTADGISFKSLYEAQAKNLTISEALGTAGVFKSTSGWSDKKYYCLHNSAVQGTIIKVTNPANGKAVFAKVLDIMPDIKQNEGLVISISNAAAQELGVKEGNFNCSINYSK